ncbi:dTDP-glucose 4,6-dehydratase [Pseudoalteromonas pernae]|uniref:dTDP-glucose 4,6-dehydratase n=1 Tax=Pseudoalteromonas pernae TaxID=3118054 RepID=UPI0032421F95
MTKKVLVTGGAGFIGANFVHYWHNAYPDSTIVVLDALTYAGNKANLGGVLNSDNIHFEHGNICNAQRVYSLLESFNIDTIVHFAAESHVDRSIDSAQPFIETNVMGTLTLLEAAKKYWFDNDIEEHRFHHVSTDEVYGSLSCTAPAFAETNQYQPNSPYSASKAASDHLVRAFHHTYGLKVTTSNCSNNYGPFHYPEKLIPLIILNILHNKPLPIYGDGLQIRDWLHVTDHCRAIDIILKDGRVGEVYNVGGNNEWRNIDIVNAICDLINQEFASNSAWAVDYPQALAAINGSCEQLITYVDDRPGHDTRYAINAEKIQQLNFFPTYQFEKGIQETINWYLNNPSWWAPLYR